MRRCRRCAATAAAAYAAAARPVVAALAAMPQTTPPQPRRDIRPEWRRRVFRGAPSGSGVPRAKRALVIEGGGMKAAYANGVLSAFEEAGHTEWGAIYGTSAGG